MVCGNTLFGADIREHSALIEKSSAHRKSSRRISGKSESSSLRSGQVFQQTASTTLADLLTPLFVANPFSAVRTSVRWWAVDEFENGLAHGGQGGLRRRPVDSFFPVLLF